MRLFSRLIWLLVGLLGASELPAAEDVSLIRVGETWRYALASDNDPAWKSTGFDDSAWASGQAGFSIGYGSYDEATTLPYTSGIAFRFRKRFTIEDLEAIRWLVLRLDHRDGLVAYLNGTEVLRRGLPGAAGTLVPAEQAAPFKPRGNAEDADITAFKSLLVRGDNVLALQVHGWTTGASGLACVPELLANFNRGPFVQNATTNAITVAWRTPVPTEGRIFFGPSPEQAGRFVDSPFGTNHVVRLTGLEPGITYHYRVQGRDAQGNIARSGFSTFRTAKASGDFRIALIGDSGTGSMAQYRIAELLRAGAPDLVLHAGDIIYPEFTSARVDLRCFSAYGRHMRTTPYYFAIGNHDLYAGVEHYRNAFYLPTNSVTGNTDYYAFDYADAHIAVLYVPYLSQYSPVPGDPQHRWLESDLAATAKPWKIIMMHNPMMTSSAHRFDDYNFNGIPDRDEIRDYVLPLASKYGVQLVVSSHDHVFERFNPTRGVHSIVSGGGGVFLYGFTAPDASSSQFWITHNAVFITATNNQMTIRAYDQFQREFDRFVIGRSAPGIAEFNARWQTVPMEDGPPDDEDGNIRGQEFGFSGVPIPSKAGEAANLGEAWVSNDATHLYLGLSGVMAYGNQEICLFLQAPGQRGVTSMAGLGNGKPDPFGEGADALDFLEQVSFSHFSPSVAFVLGDEFADATMREFQRPGTFFAGGQGAFFLDSKLTTVERARIQQFNRSPQLGTIYYERNADFIKIAIPFSELGTLGPGGEIKLAALVCSEPQSFQPLVAPRRSIDPGFLAASMTGSGLGPVVLEPLTIRLASNAVDADGDGLDGKDELRLGTNPNAADTDGDGMPDGWEVANQLNPLVRDGAADPDRDGMNNLDEYRAGTYPRDARSALRLSASREGGGIALTWRGVAGKTYLLQESTTPEGPFTDMALPGLPRVSQGGIEMLRLGDVPGAGARYYRLRLTP